MIKEQGFTLIELVVSFTIIAILSTVGIAGFVNYSRTQSIQTAATQLASTFNLAKSRAISQSKPPECSNQILNGYRVVLSTSSNSYELDAICSNNTYIILTNTLPQNITFDSIRTTSTSFFFPVIVSGVVGAGTIYLQGYGQTKTITVDNIGTVN